jgi:glycosyltransferase involved in cell wall biosynthesis
MLRIAIITSDGREVLREYDQSEPGFGTAPQALLQGLAEVPDVEVHVISCAQRAMRSPTKLSANTFFHGLHVPKIGWLRTLYQGCIRAVRRKVKEIRPDIVHGQGTERECAMAAVYSGFPNVVTVHGNMKAIAEFHRAPIGSFHWLTAKLEAWALRRTAGVFCNSAYTESRVCPVARRVWRVPNAVRLPFFVPPTEQNRSGPPVLLNVGVLSAYKQQLEILEVAGKLWRRGFRFQLQFAGASSRSPGYAADFMRLLSEAESAGYARHLGSLSTAELVAAFDRASALVHFPREESFGLVVAEALLRNLKLFAGSVGGVVDIASGVDGAELFPAQDWVGLEHSLARWLAAGFPRPQGAASTMRQRYHPEIVAKRHLEIYREVLNTRS